MTVPRPDVSIVVCTYRRFHLLGACLDALIAQNVEPARREIIVVDNGIDPVARAAFRWPAEVTLIVADRPGLSHARNLGVAAARGDIVAFIDDDAVAAPDWLSSMLRAFEEAPDAGAIGGRVVPIWPSSRPPWLDAWFEGQLSIVDLGPSPAALEDREWLAGTNMAVRAAPLRDAGPFAEHLGRFPDSLIGNEEIALLARLRERDWGVRYDRRMLVRHRITADRLTGAWLRRRTAWPSIAGLLLDQGTGSPDAPTPWHRVASYLSHVPEAYRAPASLLQDPTAFRGQGEAIAAFVRLLAAYCEDAASCGAGNGAVFGATA